jgi:hypothetical protein
MRGGKELHSELAGDQLDGRIRWIPDQVRDGEEKVRVAGFRGPFFMGFAREKSEWWK